MFFCFVLISLALNHILNLRKNHVNNFTSCLFVSFLPTGIRSQSKPNDIMGEVYRAMMSLGYVSVLLKFIGILSHY